MLQLVIDLTSLLFAGRHVLKTRVGITVLCLLRTIQS